MKVLLTVTSMEVKRIRHTDHQVVVKAYNEETGEWEPI